MLGLDVSRLAVPDYEVVTRLERLIQNHHLCNLFKVIIKPNRSKIHAITDIFQVLFITFHIARKISVWIISAVFACVLLQKYVFGNLDRIFVKLSCMSKYFVTSCVQCIVKDLPIASQCSALQFYYDFFDFVCFEVNLHCLHALLSCLGDGGEVDCVAVLWVVYPVELGRHLQRFCTLAFDAKNNLLNEVIHPVVSHQVYLIFETSSYVFFSRARWQILQN